VPSARPRLGTSVRLKKAKTKKTPRTTMTVTNKNNPQTLDPHQLTPCTKPCQNPANIEIASTMSMEDAGKERGNQDAFIFKGSIMRLMAPGFYFQKKQLCSCFLAKRIIAINHPEGVCPKRYQTLLSLYESPLQFVENGQLSILQGSFNSQLTLPGFF